MMLEKGEKNNHSKMFILILVTVIILAILQLKGGSSGLIPSKERKKIETYVVCSLYVSGGKAWAPGGVSELAFFFFFL